MDYPFVYRVHGEPSEEKIARFLRLVSILGYKVNGKYTNITPKNMQKLCHFYLYIYQKCRTFAPKFECATYKILSL